MNNRKIVIVITVLAALTILLGYLNARSIDTTSAENGSISFVAGENTVKLSYDEITALTNHEFKATEDTSSSGPASRKYKGVLLKDALNMASINDETLRASSKVIVKGLDGYVIALATDEILSEGGVYLAFERNGKALGNMKNGGSGPFQLVARTDFFSQRWCKYVIEVSVE